ncbi:hypothetical protein N7470_005082 [Penicillium chermesinum]|nr:hypothetical protein N7470_005082 [Penicillium chermesinum]
MEASFSWETDRSVRVRPRPYPGTPVVILILGMGSTRSEWNPVRRRLARTTRLVSYDRCGLGISDPSPDARTAANMARELKDVLGSVNISPPYVILCHSFGGIIAREFAELLHDEHRSDVVGMVFVEANQEKSIALWPEYNLIDMAKGLDWFKEMGLHQAGILTDEDWKGVQDENENELHGQTVQREMENYARSCETLGIKNQLVRSPPCVAGLPPVRLGRGSDEQKKLVEEKLAIYPSLNDQFQRETLKLSTKGRFRDAIGCGHSIHMVRPDIITEEVEWVLEQARSDQFES